MKRLAKMAACIAGLLTLGSLLLTLGETCRWWRLWRQTAANEENAEEPDTAEEFTPRKAILWLSGVSDYGSSEWLPEQQAFVERLAAGSPGSVVIRGNVPASAEVDRRFRRRDVWRLAGFGRPPLWVWGLHNFWQFALASVCERTYGRDIARIILARLRQAGLPANSPLLIVCGSAGAQVALASASFLRAGGCEPIYMAAPGGAFGSPQGLLAVTGFAQLAGAKDGWSRAGARLFPGRRMAASVFTRAQQEGRVTIHQIGPHGHYGECSYLDDVNTLPDGRTYAAATFEAILQLPLWKEWANL